MFLIGMHRQPLNFAHFRIPNMRPKSAAQLWILSLFLYLILNEILTSFSFFGKGEIHPQTMDLW